MFGQQYVWLNHLSWRPLSLEYCSEGFDMLSYSYNFKALLMDLFISARFLSFSCVFFFRWPFCPPPKMPRWGNANSAVEDGGKMMMVVERLRKHGGAEQKKKQLLIGSWKSHSLETKQNRIIFKFKILFNTFKFGKIHRQICLA